MFILSVMSERKTFTLPAQKQQKIVGKSLQYHILQTGEKRWFNL